MRRFFGANNLLSSIMYYDKTLIYKVIQVKINIIDR